MATKLGWAFTLLAGVDERLRKINKKLKMAFMGLRFAQVFLVLSILACWSFAVAAIYYPWYAGYLYAGAIVLLTIGLIPWAIIVSLPLKLKTVRRFVKKGPRKTAKEMTLRAFAKKLHDESIETEELLFDTAINEGRKAYDRYKRRAARMKQDEMDDLRPRP